MTMLKDVLVELIGMFLGDARLTAAILVVVALSAVLIDVAGIEPLIGGGVLPVGCLLLVIESVRRSGRQTTGS
jgi:hypothetical protein